MKRRRITLPVFRRSRGLDFSAAGDDGFVETAAGRIGHVVAVGAFHVGDAVEFAGEREDAFHGTDDELSLIVEGPGDGVACGIEVICHTQIVFGVGTAANENEVVGGVEGEATQGQGEVEDRERRLNGSSPAEGELFNGGTGLIDGEWFDSNETEIVGHQLGSAWAGGGVGVQSPQGLSSFLFEGERIERDINKGKDK